MGLHADARPARIIKKPYFHPRIVAFGCGGPMRKIALGLILLWVCRAAPAAGAEYPAPVEGDYVIKDFKFQSGEILPELRLHYRTIGVPARDSAGVVRNAVLILHG